MSSPRSESCPRRQALKLLGVAALSLTPGCRRDRAAAPVARVPLAHLEGCRRVVVALGDDRVEVSRTASGLVARSLVCTHQGCIVAWQEAERHYKCPCQGGYFDAEGRPLMGPVSVPLPLLPVRIEGDEAVVG